MTTATSDAAPSASREAPAAPESATLTLTRQFAAPPEAVFDAFTISERFARWWGPRGMTVPDCRIDLRVGGSWRTCIRSAEGAEHVVGGVYQEIERPSRLVFTWAWERGDMAGVETLVILEFAAAGEGTELRLRHEGLPSENAREMHGQGWTSALDCLVDDLAEQE